MSNRFFEEEDISTSTDTSWRGKLADELRRRNPFAELHAAAVYSTPEIYLYHKDYFRPYGAKLVLQMAEDGLGIGLYVERGYVWAADAGWTLQPHWDWHHYLHLLSNAPSFQQLFVDAKTRFPDFSFWIQSGEADDDELSLRCTTLSFATINALLNSWPGHLWCDAYFLRQVPRDVLLTEDNEGVLEQITNVVAVVEPIYLAILNRKKEIESRTTGF